MGQRREAVHTPVDAQTLAPALEDAWQGLLGEAAPHDAIVLLVAQWALETAWGRQCLCWNLGNAKARPGGVEDWCFYACGEDVPGAAAHAHVAANPTTARLQWEKGGLAGVALVPDDPWACFAAFATLADGARAWLSLQHDTFARSWPALLTGDPAQFAHALKQAGYYTAPEASYTKTLVAVANTVRAKLTA